MVMRAVGCGGVWLREAPALGADDPRDVGSAERGFGWTEKTFFFGFFFSLERKRIARTRIGYRSPLVETARATQPRRTAASEETRRLLFYVTPV
jgi:hypothetical protein